jgi:hypothetical protein
VTVPSMGLPPLSRHGDRQAPVMRWGFPGLRAVVRA